MELPISTPLSSLRWSAGWRLVSSSRTATVKVPLEMHWSLRRWFHVLALLLYGNASICAGVASGALADISWRPWKRRNLSSRFGGGSGRHMKATAQKHCSGCAHGGCCAFCGEAEAGTTSRFCSTSSLERYFRFALTFLSLSSKDAGAAGCRVGVEFGAVDGRVVIAAAAAKAGGTFPVSASDFITGGSGSCIDVRTGCCRKGTGEERT